MKSVLLFENGAEDFFKSRLPYANFLKKRGFEVIALIPKNDFQIKTDIIIIQYDFERKNRGLFQIISLVKVALKIIQEKKIDIIHSFRLQPNIINVLTNFFNKKKVILHITGLGIAFSNGKVKYLFLRFISYLIYQILFIRANKIITQNDDDFNDLNVLGIFSKKNKIIYGSGVDIDYYNPERSTLKKIVTKSHKKNKKIHFLYVSRFIFEKGVFELLYAFQKAKKINNNIHLTLIGWIDEENPRCISKISLKKWINKSYLTFIRKNNNLLDHYNQTDCFVFPSRYREGIPRVLLEALSMKLPIITSNYPGCKLTVTDNANGLLINPNSIDEISEAILKISSKPNLKKMGFESRQLAISKFSNQLIFNQFVTAY